METKLAKTRYIFVNVLVNVGARQRVGTKSDLLLARMPQTMKNTQIAIIREPL